MTVNNPLLVIVIIWLLINLTAFVMMLLDKRQSQRQDSERISEGLLFFMAAAFGALGVYVGMFVVRHKTRKWYFLLGIPLLIAENLATIYILYTLFQ